MREILECLGKGYQWYGIRRPEYRNDQAIPFLVNPQPFYLSSDEAKEVERIGRDISDFICAADELYHTEGQVKTLLDRGKPENLQGRQARYLFVRPDILITRNGFTVCEIETAPFGLALAELLNRAYRVGNFDTLVPEGVLSAFIKNNTPTEGTIIYSAYTSSYAGQMKYLAEQVFSTDRRHWKAEEVGLAATEDRFFYRAFYQDEYLRDLFVNNIVGVLLERDESAIIPSFTPHMEEKALLALVWDKRWEDFFRNRLGAATFNHLRQVVPPTWIVGEEEFFAPGLPEGIQSTQALAFLPRSKRQFVLKRSGFGAGSSWSEGVVFLQEKTRNRVEAILKVARKDTSCLYVVQEFRRYEERPLTFEGYDHASGGMSARIRLTPYFSLVRGTEGQLVAIKATGCGNTNYVHATTASINMAVAQYD